MGGHEEVRVQEPAFEQQFLKNAMCVYEKLQGQSTVKHIGIPYDSLIHTYPGLDLRDLDTYLLSEIGQKRPNKSTPPFLIGCTA